MSDLILRLALPSPLRRLFDYRAPRGIPRSALQPGIRLLLPFGRRELVGVLIEVTDRSEVPEDKLKPALRVLDAKPPMPAHLLELCRWTAQYYQHSLGDTLSWALPNLLRQGEPAEARQQRFWHATAQSSLDDPRLARAPRQRQALAILKQHPHGVSHELLNQLQINKDSLDLLKEKGLVELEVRRHSTPPREGGWLAQAELPLNPEQRAAFEAVRASHGGFHCFLLAGVTGSGKTEVYLQLIRETLAAGRQALVLIPEINLGPQTLARFERRFNARIALLHSALTDRERLDAWLAARDGEADIVIGTRSALFTPLKRPGLIIVDEEHDASYKQQDGLRYHARDLALVRARLENVPILLGSATPALESLHNAQAGRYGLLRLTQRAGGAHPPKFIRLDVKSMPLDAGLHHCDHRQRPPMNCPQCGKLDLRPVGAGTERAEERLRILFPNHPVLRIDRDSTSRKHAMRDLFATINSGEPCILVGTQMLAKGHHFPRVTLVAILDADGGLFSADFRASERMAQQIVQVAGRAGRAEEPGRVLIQTHLADHPLLVQLTEDGYFAFAEQALSERRAAGLPPFAHLALLRAEAHKPGQAEAFLDSACSAAEQLLEQMGGPEVELLGPVPAPMERRAGKHRAQLLLQCMSRAPLHRLLTPWLQSLEQLPGGRQVRWSLDIDPIDLF